MCQGYNAAVYTLIQVCTLAVQIKVDVVVPVTGQDVVGKLLLVALVLLHDVLFVLLLHVAVLLVIAFSVPDRPLDAENLIPVC